MDKVLKKILDIKSQKGISDRDFARALNLGDTVVSDWKREQSKSYLKHIPEISNYLGIPSSVLFDLQLEKMRTIPNYPDIEKIQKRMNNEDLNRVIYQTSKLISSDLSFEITYSLNEMSLLRHFRMLTESGQTKVLDYMSDLIDTGKYTKNKAEKDLDKK